MGEFLLSTTHRPIPSYAYSWRPYASDRLIFKEVKGPDGLVDVIIDPWNQRWVITRKPAAQLLKLADGTRRFSRIIGDLGTFPTDLDPVMLAEELRIQGMLFDNSVEHHDSGRPVYNVCDFSYIAGIHIETTNRCNMQCAHCYVASGKPLPNELALDEILRVVDTLPPWAGKRVAISGGEPALRSDAISLLNHCSVTRGLDVDWYTNGKRFPRGLAERMLEINSLNRTIVRLQLSLEGHTAALNDMVRGKGAFKEALKGLELFKQVGLNRYVVLFVCVTKHNIPYVEDMIRFASNQDVAMLVFTQWQKQGYAKESLAPTNDQWVAAGEVLLRYSNPRLRVFGNFFGDLGNDELGRYRLDAPFFPKQTYCYNVVPRITPDGNVLADQLWVDPKWVLGNVRERPLSEWFSTSKFYDQFSSIRQREWDIAECSECEWRQLCMGGSAGLAYAEFGTLRARDSFCEARKYWFQRYVDYQVGQLALLT